MEQDHDAARQKRILDAFDQVLDMDEGRREAWLGGVFADDAEAVAAVRKLIAADAVTRSGLTGEGGGAPLVVPDHVGPWRLDRLIGAGGMGEVWLGVRDDGLFEQSVAVKLMRPGRYAAASQAFFDSERRALARLSHPGIARLMDGGVSEAGVPWFVMELIDGQPMQVHAAGRPMTREASLWLMAGVAGAVQYAHQQLVVHADLKPSNILVTADGAPRLVDFGIAAMTAEAAMNDERTVFPSTPAFASPERLAGAPPAPADDIFALGLLLHGLLSGAWPTAPVTGPLPPTGDAACDAIIARACASSAAERYATAQAFADDVVARLEHRPASFQRGDWRIAGRLMARRHPRAVTAAVGGLAATVAALVVISVLYVQATQARRLAEQRFADVRELAGYMLGDFHDDLLKLPGATSLRERNAAVASRYLTRLAQDGRVPVDVEHEIAVGFARFGNAQATSGGDGSGAVKSGDDGLLEGEKRLRDLVRRYPGRDDFKRDLAKILAWRSGVIAGELHDLKGARAALDESMAIDDGILKRHPGDVDAAYNRWNTSIASADMYRHANDMAAVKAVMEGAQARFKSLATPPKYVSQRPMLEAATENSIGDAEMVLSGPAAAMAHYRKAEAILGTAIDGGVRDVRLFQRRAYYDSQVAAACSALGQPSEAMAWVERGQALVSGLAAYDDGPTTQYLVGLFKEQRVAVLKGR